MVPFCAPLSYLLKHRLLLMLDELVKMVKFGSIYMVQLSNLSTFVMYKICGACVPKFILSSPHSLASALGLMDSPFLALFAHYPSYGLLRLWMRLWSAYALNFAKYQF